MTEDFRYAELHAHSAFSFLDGASQPAQLAQRAHQLGLGAMALTDHDGLYGVVQFAEAAAELDLPAIFGSELTVDGGPEMPGSKDPAGTHLVVLARGPAGYRNLARAISEGYLVTGTKGPPRFTLEALAEAAGGHWQILTGCRKGPLRRALESEGTAAARRELDRLIDLFGRDNVAVEITDWADPLDSRRCDLLAGLAEAAGTDLVATGNVHYATLSQAPLASALAAVRARDSLAGLDGWLPAGHSGYLRSTAQMLARHARHPQAVHTAARIGAECAFDLHLVAPCLPPYPVPPGHDEASWLRVLVERGAQARYGPRGPGAQKAYQQLDHELEVITELTFPGYFLIVYDIVEFCRRNHILCQGRGSAANSAVCYALGITAVDAVQHGLLFERFLAPERDGPPDIDIDIESKRREEVIQYVYDRYGRSNAALVANVISYRPRSAIRDAAKALGFDTGQQDAWSRRIERWGTLRGRELVSQSWGTAKVTTESSADDLEGIPDQVIDLAEQMMKLPRHLGIHPGGMVLCDRPIIEVCPVQWGRMPQRSILQWDKDDCASAGLVKFDLLGLGMLTALRIAFEQVAEFEGIELALHDLPQEDPAVYDLLCAADTVGVFQVESRAQMATLPRLQPRKFYDIVVEVALIRPGPIQGGSVHPYIERARGRQPVTYDHELLRPALEKTLGVPLFQEQLMQMAIDAANFTAAEADQLRRAMGSKRSPERMAALHDRLLAGMASNGIDAVTGERIFDKLRAFADFGFPESHAFSFAYLVYASAWLKVHHPAAFYAALLAAQPMGFYSPQSLVADARHHGITVHRPDVTRSRVQASVEIADDGALDVRLGLLSVKAMSTAGAERIVAERTARPFANLADLARRCGLTAGQLEALATAGALVAFDADRHRALWSAGALAGEHGGVLAGTASGVQAPRLPGMSEVEVSIADAWATGITPDSFPTQYVRDRLGEFGAITVADMVASPDGTRVKIGGVVTHRQRPSTAAGVTFLSLEDETGLANVVCSAGVWKRFRQVARTSAALVIRGRVECADGAVNLVAEHVAPLSLRIPSKSRDFQ